MTPGVICLPFCTCLAQPRRAVKRRSLPGALYYIAHGLLVTTMVTGLACALLLGQHKGEGSLSSLSQWQDVDAKDQEGVGRFLLKEAFYRALIPLLVVSPLLTGATLMLFALHIRGSPIVYPWVCPTTMACVTVLHLACALYPLPLLLHEADLVDGEWAAAPEVGKVWVSALRLNKATAAFAALGWGLMWVVWLMSHCSQHWKAEPHFDLVDEWVVTNEDTGASRTSIGKPGDDEAQEQEEEEEEEETPVDEQQPKKRRSRRIAAAQKPQSEMPDELPEGTRSYHLRKKLVPVPTERLRAVRSCSDPAMLTASLLLILSFLLLLFSFLFSSDLLTWTETRTTPFSIFSGRGAAAGEHRLSVGWTNGTDVSTPGPLPSHSWSALHRHSLPHSQTGWGMLAFALLVLVQGPGTLLLWFRLTAAGEKEGLFQLSQRFSPVAEAVGLAVVDGVANTGPLLLLWKAYRGLSEEWRLEGRKDLGLGWSGWVLLTALVCRLVAVAVVAVRLAGQTEAWRAKQVQRRLEQKKAETKNGQRRVKKVSDDDESEGTDGTDD